MSVKIICDTAADLTKELYEQHEIEALSLLVNIDGKEYRDLYEIEPKELFDKMRAGSQPTTAQVSYITFEETFSKYLNSGESVIYIAFSSELSGTYQTAKLVESDIKEKNPDFDITIIDSKCASLGLGFVVLEAAKMAKEDRSKEEILERIDYLCKHMEHIFTVDNLEYLYRGGRVSKAAAVAGTALKIKPILDVQDGKLIPIDKKRGRKKALAKVIEVMGERGTNLASQTVGINHGDDLETALFMKEQMETNFGVKDFIINDLGSAIGAHTGPGLISIYFINDNRK